MPFDIFYICDREKCDPCHEPCEHTKEITHAKNFRFWGGAFWESHEKETYEEDINETGNKKRDPEA